MHFVCRFIFLELTINGLKSFTYVKGSMENVQIVYNF